MFKSGDCIRCLDATGYPLSSGANYLVSVGQVDGGAMISIVGYEGAFLASRFELVQSSEPVDVEAITKRREAAIKACVIESLTRAGGAALNVAKRAHALVGALEKHCIDGCDMAERSSRLLERMHGSRVCIDMIVDDLGLAGIVDRNAGCFDQEQLLFDVKNKVTQVLRELV
jgi:hypothetical protein